MADANTNDLDELRARFPSWDFEARWATAASGPDRRVLLAHHGDITVSAWSASALASEIQRQDRQA